MKQNFIDQVHIFCRSGNGGRGSVHLLRNRMTAKGGPDGGDGGNGGSIFIRASRHISTLYKLSFQKHVLAEDGQGGSGNQKKGCDGKDITLEVPIGTIVRTQDTREVIAKVDEYDQTKIILKGGRGGLGNVNFKTATKQTPRFAQPGEEGQEAWLQFELKLLADVGLIGLPNAGKSTLLSKISAAKPKIGAYPFTTISPSVGVVSHKEKSFVVADLPGLIEGASKGAGMGFQFLRHTERNGVLLFVISVESENVIETYNQLNTELNQFNEALKLKERFLVISKKDLLEKKEIDTLKKKMKHIPHIFISSFTQEGLEVLKDTIIERLYITVHKVVSKP